jgi:tetratricopeptide (TPR) repeat protein
MRSAVLLGAVLLAAAPLQAADAWYQSYEKGLKAIAARQWEEAERQLKAAAASGPRPGRQVRAYGMRFMDFIPGYHLGVVYFNQQRYREALEELQRVEGTGLVARGDAEHARLTDMIEQATARQAARAATTPAPPPASPAPTPARAAASPPSDAPREMETLLASARERLAGGDLAAARQALESARAKDPDHPGLATVAEAIGRREADQRARAEQETRDRDAARRAESEAQVKESQRVELEKDVAELARLVSARDYKAARRKASAVARKDPRHPELLRLQAEMDRRLAAPLEIERAAIRAFYGGRYESAVELLGPLAADADGSPRAVFYLACSHAALGLIKGEAGAPLLTRARELFARVRSARPALADGEKRLISPRILRMYESG